MSAPTVLTHTLTDSDVSGGSVTLGIPTLASATFFQAYGSHGGADSVYRSNKVKWGDTTAPTITSASTFSQMELFPLAFALTANETVSWSITGGADQLQFAISGSTLMWIGNGTENYDAPADVDTNNTYIAQVTATDLSGNATNQTITGTVTQAVKTPSNSHPWFTNVVPSTPSTQYTSNTLTVVGLTAGLSVPVTLTGSGTYSKNGGAYTSANGTAQNGDTFTLQTTSGPGATDVVNLTLGIGVGVDTWTVSNTSVTTTLTSTTGTSKYRNLTVSGTPALNFSMQAGDGNHQSVRATAGRSGKKVFEATITTVPPTNQWFAIGVDDGTTDFNATTPVTPGNGANGFCMIYSPNNQGWGWIIQVNQTSPVSGTNFLCTAGDTVTCVVDNTPAAGSHTITYYVTRSGTTTLLGTATGLTIPATYYAFVGDSASGCVGSVNFGATAFARTLGGGESAYS